ncbi:MAG: methyltransferase domain-containing protein [Burkholderiales bacterium]
MPPTNPVLDRYLSDDYLKQNPTWDAEDSPWKAGLIAAILRENHITPGTLADVGCGAGQVLLELQGAFPDTLLEGYDISPDAEQFWPAARAAGIRLSVGSFFNAAAPRYDVLLALDVIEHLQDPFEFLGQLRGRGAHFVFHFPLDLSASSILRESPLLHVRRKVGHVHYFTRGLALALLEECGYQIVDARYTGAAFTSPQRGWTARLAQLPRRIVFALNHDWGARLLGGETLIVLATAKNAL